MYRGVALAVAAALAVGTAGAAAAAQPAARGAYTAEQAEAGGGTYARECAVCHQANLQGSFEAPPLAGASFLRFWGDLTPRDLFDRIRVSMPPDRPGALGEDAYLDIVAYLLAANGAAPGGTALDASAAVTIASVAGGAAPGAAGAAATAAPSPVPTAAPVPSASPAAETGVTLAGVVDGYRLVSDAMLRDPDPRDWLMIRGN